VLKGSKAVTVTLTGTGSLFTIGAGQNLTLAQNITLEGVTNNTKALIQVSASGVFVMKDDSKIINNECVNNSGGGVQVNGGSFTMRDSASISNNIVRKVDNRTGVGGGVMVISGTFTMRDSSSVSNNISDEYGGGVFILGGSSFTMQGNASVSGNTATNGGGGVFLTDAGAMFTMRDSASVSGNTASGGGGGVHVNESSTFTMEGGTISGNKAQWGGGVLAYNTAAFTKKGGTIYGDTDNTFGNGPSTDNTATAWAHAVGAGKQRKTTAGPAVKLYASYNGSSWSYDGTSVGVGNTTSNWE
jgi:parallel beta-helix repeat protein